MGKGRIVINFEDGIDENDVVRLVSSVIRQGRVSERGKRRLYSFVSEMLLDGEHYVVVTNERSKYDSFTVKKSTISREIRP